MKARAPGKLVLSGAYAVLEGAPALVAAVDRYAEADTERQPTLVTDEVMKAIELGDLARAPGFDASALREWREGAERKLGLGSSAAILVASLGAALLEQGIEERELGERVYPLALRAHRAAQPGGSGVDVAASSFGGVLRCQLDGVGQHASLAVSPHALPGDLVLEVYACARSASTQTMLSAVRAFATAEPERYQALIHTAIVAAREAVRARQATELIASVSQQRDVLGELGRAAGADIVTREVAAMDAHARRQGACFAPSGAGGGDIAVRYALGPSTDEFREDARNAGLRIVGMQVGARGVHRAA